MNLSALEYQTVTGKFTISLKTSQNYIQIPSTTTMMINILSIIPWSFLLLGSIASVGMAALAFTTKMNAFFVFIFVFRYLRLIVHMFSYYFLYKPTPLPANPTLKPEDVTIIIPTIDPENEGFQECLRTVLQNQPGAVLIVTVGKAKVKLVERVVRPFRRAWPSTEISVTQTAQANKRRQVCHAIPQVKTPITVLVDDHVYWPSLNFLPTILAPFEDPQVGGLGTNKVVRRTGRGFAMNSIFNFLGCVYLERHNFEITATNALDGGVFVISGRTAAYRTSLLNNQTFLNEFANEMFFFGRLGPINPDDDNKITRHVVKSGYKLVIQNHPDATIETDLGNPGKYLSQCLRWARTTWRSNSCSLFTDRTVWCAQPWCVYAVYITSFFNFALFYDAALLISLYNTTFGGTGTAILIMMAWIFASKMVKLLPHFRRHPKDLLLIPAYLIFAYYHSIMKLWALFTFWDCSWGGRNLAAVDASANNDDGDDDSSDSDDDDDDDGLLPGRGSSSSYSSRNSYTTARSRRSHTPSPSSCLGGGSSHGGSPYGGFPHGGAPHGGSPAYGKQSLFNRFFESDTAAPVRSGTSYPSTTGSTQESASYEISRWAMWEKASHPDRVVSKAQPIPIPRSIPTPYPTSSSNPRSGFRNTPRTKPSPECQSKGSVLNPHNGHQPTTKHNYRSPIWTRFAAPSSTGTKSSSSASSTSRRYAYVEDSEESPGTSPTLNGWPCDGIFSSPAPSRPSTPATSTSRSTARRHAFVEDEDAEEEYLQGMSPTLVNSSGRCVSSSNRSSSPRPSRPSTSTTSTSRSTARRHAYFEDTEEEEELPADKHPLGGGIMEPRPQYNRRWERGSDCRRQHDEGMDLNWGECGLPGDARDVGF